ncbi:MAG TPA: hypothetical protein DIT25_01965 [Candidatus Moranbacteria bacterium]|nr:hypothetical protein [Candidatus Moranbacteria bacterium]
MSERKTTHTIEELKEMMKRGRIAPCEGFSGIRTCCGSSIAFSDALPLGAILNEIGLIFLEEGSPEAEDVLAELFNDNSGSNVGSLAYFYLSQRESTIKPTSLAKVKTYEMDPANTDTIVEVKEKIAELALNIED